MAYTDPYEILVVRNKDYIAQNIQDKIRNTRLLIAGCGMGSMFAEGALRLGCQHMILADGDIVSSHNLNRQNFTNDDVGHSKVKALQARLLSISPQADIQILDAFVTSDILEDLVGRVDVVFDTIDFLDLETIIQLHEECHRQGKPVISALNIGWGGGCLYFPPDTQYPMRRLLELPPGSLKGRSYIESYKPLIARLEGHLRPDVMYAVKKTMDLMADGTPCPASQLVAGTHGVSSLAVTLLYRLLAGLPITPSPELLVVDMHTVLTGSGISLAGERGVAAAE